MSAIFRMVTAQRLADGAALYLTPARRWSQRLADGALHAGVPEAEAALASAQDFVDAREIVGPYLIEVAKTAAGVESLSQRERIRSLRTVTFAIDHGSWLPAGGE